MSERGGREAEEGGYRTKNKNPTRQCGELFHLHSPPNFTTTTLENENAI